LLAYGPNLLGMYRQSGVMIGKVLQGSKPADLPICETLGVTTPTSIQLQGRHATDHLQTIFNFRWGRRSPEKLWLQSDR
jgi:hypothetical protein